MESIKESFCFSTRADIMENKIEKKFEEGNNTRDINYAIKCYNNALEYKRYHLVLNDKAFIISYNKRVMQCIQSLEYKGVDNYSLKNFIIKNPFCSLYELKYDRYHSDMLIKSCVELEKNLENFYKKNYYEPMRLEKFKNLLGKEQKRIDKRVAKNKTKTNGIKKQHKTKKVEYSARDISILEIKKRIEKYEEETRRKTIEMEKKRKDHLLLLERAKIAEEISRKFQQELKKSRSNY